MRTKSLLDRRNQLIYDQYCQLWQSGLREEKIWPELKDAFHLEEDTLYRIVLKFIKEARTTDKNIAIPEDPKDAIN